MANDSTFGSPPERLRRLLLFGRDESDDNEQPIASWDMLNEKPGSEIGRYRLVQVIGEGGMGIVYLAEQEKPIKRQVALKVIKPGMDSKRVIARFEAERQTLALLDHPNIAHVYDAGTTEAGRPYFVMEYVEGLSITEHCDRHKLTIEDRLNLFRQVCHAVHHAHQKGIIHRDIKPSNILVSLQEDQALPKIIDFGVAKALAQPLTERTLVTEQGQLFGTPEYMSPEQTDMANEDIDTRSDIYSLGVLLYVLLTGVLPFDSATFREGGIEHIRQVIRETDPKTPSTRLSSLGEEAKKVAQSRRTEVATLARCLHKELEWIPLKAMRKERSERYRSASEFADDIENYLKGEALLAGPLSTVYRLKKFVRRNRTLVTGVAAVLAVLTGGVIVSTLFAFGQARARTESQAVTDFLAKDVLGSVDKVKGREATVADILGAASKSLGGRLEDQPIVEADIHQALGMTYYRLRDHRGAIPHLARSYQLRREQFVVHKEPAMNTKNFLAIAYTFVGEYKEAERLFDELIEETDPEDRHLPGRKCNRACVYIGQGRYEEAEQILLDMLNIGTAWWEWWGHKGYHYLSHLGVIYFYQGRYEEAEQRFNQFVDDQGEFALAWGTIPRLGYLYMAQGRYKEAENLFTRGIEYGNRELPGKDNPKTLMYMNGLAVLRTRQKQYDEAERLFRKAFEARRRKLGDDHPDTLETKNDLAVLYKELGRYNKAEELLLEAVKGRSLKLGDEHPHTLESLKNLIELYEAWGKPDEAAKWQKKLPQMEAAEQ